MVERKPKKNKNYMSPKELQVFLGTHSLTPHRFADVVGLTKPAVDHWLSGRREVPPPVIKIIKLIKAQPSFIDWFEQVS